MGLDKVYQQELLDPLGNGYHMDSNGQLKPTTTDVPPAPDAIVEMVRCQCQGTARQIIAHASQRSCYVQTYVFAAHTAIMMSIHIMQIVTQMMTVMVDVLLRYINKLRYTHILEEKGS